MGIRNPPSSDDVRSVADSLEHIAMAINGFASAYAVAQDAKLLANAPESVNVPDEDTRPGIDDLREAWERIDPTDTRSLNTIRAERYSEPGDLLAPIYGERLLSRGPMRGDLVELITETPKGTARRPAVFLHGLSGGGWRLKGPDGATLDTDAMGHNGRPCHLAPLPWRRGMAVEVSEGDSHRVGWVYSAWTASEGKRSPRVAVLTPDPKDSAGWTHRVLVGDERAKLAPRSYGRKTPPWEEGKTRFFGQPADPKEIEPPGDNSDATGGNSYGTPKPPPADFGDTPPTRGEFVDAQVNLKPGVDPSAWDSMPDEVWRALMLLNDQGRPYGITVDTHWKRAQT